MENGLGTCLILVCGVNGSLVAGAPAALTVAYPDLPQMRHPGELPGLDQPRPLGLHLAKCQVGVLLVVRPDGIDDDRDVLAPLEQTQGRHFHGSFETGPDQNKLAGPQLAQEPVNPRLIERIDAALVQNDLPVPPQHIPGQVRIAVGGENHPVGQQRIVDLLLTVRAVDAVTNHIITVVAGVHLGRRDDRNVQESGPRHDSADVRQDPPVVSDAGFALGQKKISLRIDIDEDLFATRSN